MTTIMFTQFTLLTCSVLRVSSIEAGVTAQIIDVFAFPPREFCNIRVNLQSRNGTNILDKEKHKISLNLYKNNEYILE